VIRPIEKSIVYVSVASSSAEVSNRLIALPVSLLLWRVVVYDGDLMS
jgi:hypothetical protein